MVENIEKYFIDNPLFDNIEENMNIQTPKFLSDFLEFICFSKKVDIENQNKILLNFKNKLFEICFNNIEKLEEFIIANLVSFQRMKNSNVNDEIENFIKFLNLIKVLTQNLNSTNQIMSNCISQINKILDYLISKDKIYEITNENIIPILKLLELNTEITININSYNPRLIPFLDRIINFCINYKENKKEKIEKIELMYPDQKNKEIIKFLNQKISKLIISYSDNLKNDINYDILFSFLYEDIKNYIEQNNKYKIFYDKFINTYEETKNKTISKKMFPMNFLIIKPKPIPSLEPDYDLSFLGDSPEFINEKEKKIKMEKIMKHKVKSTEKQAIRKLKKEARYIDKERQKVIDNINLKRKEDLKISNQFLEQQNIEYKKMMTSNPKRRFKFKRNKSKKK
jgi:hypothetical protein